MEHIMMDNGLRVKFKGLEIITMQTETDIKEILWVISLVGKELYIMQMEIYIKENGERICTMGKEHSSGRVERYIKEILVEVKNMDLANISGLTVAIMKENGQMISWRVREPLVGPMEGHTKDNGKITWCMEVEITSGLMVVNIRESIIAMRNMDGEFLFGQLMPNMKGHGWMAKDMERGVITPQVVKAVTEYGTKINV